MSLRATYSDFRKRVPATGKSQEGRYPSHPYSFRLTFSLLRTISEPTLDCNSDLCVHSSCRAKREARPLLVVPSTRRTFHVTTEGQTVAGTQVTNATALAYLCRRENRKTLPRALAPLLDLLLYIHLVKYIVEVIMKRKAVIVGINKYRDSSSNLRGCVNDALDMKWLLTKFFRYKELDVKLLLDGQATRHNILNSIDWLIKGSKSGDILTFHFSGHGSRIFDRSGDESDKMDELICPHDMNWQYPLIDDILASKFKKAARGAKLYLIFDCCHSGTISRADMSAGLYQVPRFLPPPPELDGDSKNVNKMCSSLRYGGGWLILLLNKLIDMLRADDVKSRFTGYPHVLLSGCRDDQTSADAYIAGKYAGAFTWHLVNYLRQYPRSDIKTVHREVRNNVARKGYSQRPQLYAAPGFLHRPFCYK